MAQCRLTTIRPHCYAAQFRISSQPRCGDFHAAIGTTAVGYLKGSLGDPTLKCTQMSGR